MNDDLHIAILAAGEARRFGGYKLDALVGNRPLGRFTVECALKLGTSKPVIIVGQHVPEFARTAAEQGLVDLLSNSCARDGISTSVALAAADAESSASKALLLLLADMPLVTIGTLRRLVAAVGPRQPAAVRHADGRPGIPACFPSDYFPALQDLHGDKGASALLRGAGSLSLIDVAADELRDVDKPEDLPAIVAAGLASRHNGGP